MMPGDRADSQLLSFPHYNPKLTYVQSLTLCLSHSTLCQSRLTIVVTGYFCHILPNYRIKKSDLGPREKLLLGDKDDFALDKELLCA
jgi:hypothetical protein